MKKHSLAATILLLCLSVPIQAPAQVSTGSDLLRRTANLTIGDTLLEDALRALHQSSGVSIAFSPDLLPPDFNVSCPCDDNTVEEALRRILRGTELTFEATRTLIRIVPPPPPTPEQEAGGTLTGTLTSADSGSPVVNAMIRLDDGRGVLSDENGRFLLLGIPPGDYDLTVSGMGWEETTLEGISVRKGETTVLGISLSPLVISLAEMVVAPSTYGMMKETLAPNQTLSREEMRTLPQLGEDLFRIADRLPGISTNDFTARLYVRGSRADEVITLMDGLELYEPYHLKQWDAVLSILDVETVGDVDLITGGFPSEYGDRSAGVFSLHSVEPRTDRIHTAVGLSFMNLSLKNEGGFADGKGSWLFTARRGFMDIVFDIADVDGDFHPKYYDLFGKVNYEVKPGHRLSARVLHAGDDLSGADADDLTSHDDRYGSSYLWLTWDGRLSESITTRTILSGSRIYKHRHGQDFAQDPSVPSLDVRDRQETWFVGLKSDVAWEVSPRVAFKAGFDLKQGWADYTYVLWRDDYVPNFDDPSGPPFYAVTETRSLATKPHGLHGAAYLGNRLRVTDKLTTDVGARYSRNSQTSEGSLSPRVSASYQLDPGTAIRGAWGRYAQPQMLHELQVADGDTLFHPAQDAEHRILGIEHQLLDRITLRVEAFQRFTDDPFHEYRNLVDRVEAVWEEGPGDRVGVFPEESRSQGVEMLARGPLGPRVAWSASYAFSKAEDRIDGAWIPRPHDQRHTAHLHVSVRPSANWTVSTAWQSRTGWPASEQVYEIVTLATGDPVVKNTFGELNSVRLPDYRRLDVRVSRRFDTSRGRLFVNLDLFNALGRENPQALDYDLFWFDPYRRAYEFGKDIEEQIPRLVTLGLRWEF